MKVYVVMAEHPWVPGMVLKVKDSLQAANKEAAELVNIQVHDLLHDLEIDGVADEENWQDIAESIEAAEGGYVAVHECEVENQ